VTNPGGAVVVAPGLGRLIAVALAVLVGCVVWRRRSDPAQTLWLSALVLLRVVCVRTGNDALTIPCRLALLRQEEASPHVGAWPLIAAAGVFASDLGRALFGPWCVRANNAGAGNRLWCARPGSIRADRR